MKNFLAVLVCALFASALARPEVNQAAAQASKDRLGKAHEKCQADATTAVDEAALKQLLKSGGPPPANIGAHSLCISKTLGWQSEDGSVNKSLVETAAAAIYGQNEQLQQLVNECSAAKPTAEETAINLLNCYKKNVPRA